MTPVSDGSDADSKDQSPAKSKAMARDSNDTALVSGSDGAKSGKKKLTSLSDIKNATDAKKLRESEAENRARAGNEN